MQARVQDDRLATIRAAFPKEGLFAEKEWLLTPDPFPIAKKFLAELEQLGHRLFVFQRACNQLYQLSVKGKQPAWIAQYLDAGKPRELIEFSRRKEIRDDLPRVIRPDLILTEKDYMWFGQSDEDGLLEVMDEEMQEATIQELLRQATIMGNRLNVSRLLVHA